MGTKSEDKVYRRWCKDCDELKTMSGRYGTVCERCKTKNHQARLERNLFGRQEKELTVKMSVHA